MKRYRLLFLIALCLSLAQRTVEQTPTKTESALPRLVRFGGTVKNPDGSPPTGVVGITFLSTPSKPAAPALAGDSERKRRQ